MEIISGIGAIFTFLLVLMAILMPLFIYLNQKYTWQVRNEQRKTNKLLAELIQGINQKNTIRQPSPTPDNASDFTFQDEPQEEPTVSASCPGCMKKFTYKKEQGHKQGTCPHCNKTLLFPPFIPGKTYTARPIE